MTQITLELDDDVVAALAASVSDGAFESVEAAAAAAVVSAARADPQPSDGDLRRLIVEARDSLARGEGYTLEQVRARLAERTRRAEEAA